MKKTIIRNILINIFNNKEYINKYIDIFKNISENMIEDLKNGKNERVEKKEKEFTPVVCKEFEDKRNNFL